VKEEHYEVVGDALLKTLQQGLGAAWTPEVETAWIDVYGVLASTMKDAASVPA
jgi:hemoglobin-like flavoprotein